MTHEIIHTGKAPAAIGPYSQAIKVGPWLFVSGQIALAPTTGELCCQDLDGQARQVLANLQEILFHAGFRLSDVVSVDVFLTDITRFGAFNEVYGGFFGDHKPARAVVEVKGLPRGAQVELKCIAHRGD
jgi:2-iminobutanoate/2-iminopropanoate deaminase